MIYERKRMDALFSLFTMHKHLFQIAYAVLVFHCVG